MKIYTSVEIWKFVLVKPKNLEKAKQIVSVVNSKAYENA